MTPFLIILLFYNSEDSLFQAVHLQQADGRQRSKTSFFQHFSTTFKDIEQKDTNKDGNFLNRHSLFS